MRYALTLLVGTVFVAWVDARQTAGALTAGERLKQLHDNRKLVERLVGHSVTLAGANSPLDRAVACHGVMSDLTGAIDTAIVAQNPNRVAELGDHLADIVTEALVPNLNEAEVLFPARSAERIRLVELHKSATEELKKLELSVPRTDALGRSNQVVQMRARWTAALMQLSASNLNVPAVPATQP